MLVASTGFKFLQGLQGAFNVLSILNLTNYIFPHDAVVNDGASFDFIIVGAGTAGSVIANRLTEIENINVLLIEAGGNPPFESDLPGLPILLKRSRHDWNYTAENDGYKDTCHLKPYFEFTQGKMLGGTSSLNYMIYHKGQPHDFDSWAEIVGDDTWEWKNVLPYFKKSLRLEDPELLNSPSKDFYGTDGYVGLTRDHRKSVESVLDAYKELGHNINLDFNEYNELGYAAQTVTISGRSRQGSAYAFLSTAKHRKNLHVMKNTLVTKILFDGNKNAVGVEVITKDGNTMQYKANKEVIISAGTINTPKLLMLSGIGPKEHLKNKGIQALSDLPVGENLQDHMCVILLHVLKQPAEPLPDTTPYELPGASLTGFVALNKSYNYPDYQVTSYLGDSKLILLYCTFAFRFKNEICDAMGNAYDTRVHAFTEVNNLRPKSRGKVLLKSTDPFEAPLVYNGYFSNKEDVEDLIDYVQDYAPILNTTYYKSMDAKMLDLYPKCNAFEFGSRDYWRCYIMCVSSGLSHFSSTCPMGTVLDGRLRVQGVKKLRVADASVMPSITGGNPLGAILMIGEKAADLIKADYNLI